MTSASPIPPRQLACERCGTTFECKLGGGCWCNDETVKLPLPAIGGGDCLCPACLRQAAEAQQQQQQ